MATVLTRLVVVGAGIALTACGGVTSKELLSHAESHLYYPGSRVTSKAVGAEDRGLDTGRIAAGTTVTLAVTAPMARIYSWYETELAARGWKLRKTETINDGYELFTKGTREVFQLSPGRDPGTYIMFYSIRPAQCATTDPMPIDRAFGNC
jgi:hypothetical protein